MIYFMLVGYGARHEEVGVSVPAQAPVATKRSLRNVLSTLGMTPLNKVMVSAEKKTILDSMLRTYHLRYLGAPFVQKVLLVAAVIACAFFVSALLSDSAWGDSLLFLAATCCALSYSLWVKWQFDKCFPYGEPVSAKYIQWARESLRDWDVAGNPLPAEARAKATALQRALPDVQIFVDWVYPDPFLVALYEGEEEFIYQWK